MTTRLHALERADDAPCVSVLHVRALIEATAVLGVPAGAFLAGAGVAPECLLDAGFRWTVDELDRLTAVAVTLSAEPAFGLRWGELAPMQNFDVIGLVFGQAPTIRAGLDVLLRCQAILGAHPELELEESRTCARLTVRPAAHTELARCVRAELGLCGLVRLFRAFGAAEPAQVLRVEFAHARPPYHAEYTRVFGAPCRFRCAETLLEVERSLLDRPLATANPELHQVIVAHADRVLARVNASARLAQQVRDEVSAALPVLLTIQTVARRRGMSERSLRRRLADEGASFVEIVQDVQRGAAERMIDDHGRTIQQVAFESGFTSVTGFHRAFRRWTGASPNEYRARRK